MLGVPYKISIAEFKPLKVNEIHLKLSLTMQSAVGSSAQQGVFVYDKFTFTVKSVDSNEIDLKEIPSEKIEETINTIFQSTAH